MAGLKIATSNNRAAPHDPVLAIAAGWRRARTRAMAVWAADDEASEFGTMESPDVREPKAEIEEMKRKLELLAYMAPTTVVAAKSCSMWCSKY